MDSSRASSSFTLSVTNESVEIILETVSLNLAGWAVDNVTSISSEDICFFPQAIPTAVGIACGKKQISSEDILVTLSTAHPAKFKETVSSIISTDSFVTDKVKELEALEESMIIVENDVSAIRDIIDKRVSWEY